jgi:hypothetical protein
MWGRYRAKLRPRGSVMELLTPRYPPVDASRIGRSVRMTKVSAQWKRRRAFYCSDHLITTKQNWCRLPRFPSLDPVSTSRPVQLPPVPFREEVSVVPRPEFRMHLSIHSPRRANISSAEDHLMNDTMINSRQDKQICCEETKKCHVDSARLLKKRRIP